MVCPTCGLVNPDSALRCDCGHTFTTAPPVPSTSSEPIEPPSPPPVWFGFVTAAAFLVGEFVELIGLASEGTQVGPVTLSIALLGWAFWFYCVHRWHAILHTVSRSPYPISPSFAVIGHFLPFFNLYWIFKWPTELSRFLADNRIAAVLPGWVVGLLILAASLISRLFDGAAGLAVLFSVAAYLDSRIRTAILTTCPTTSLARALASTGDKSSAFATASFVTGCIASLFLALTVFFTGLIEHLAPGGLSEPSTTSDLIGALIVIGGVAALTGIVLGVHSAIQRTHRMAFAVGGIVLNTVAVAAIGVLAAVGIADTPVGASGPIVLSEAVSEMNRNLPMMIDEETELVNTGSTEGEIIFNYRMVNFDSGAIDSAEFLDVLTPEVRGTACSSPEMKVFWEHGIRARLVYRGRDSQIIGEVLVEAADCDYSQNSDAISARTAELQPSHRGLPDFTRSAALSPQEIFARSAPSTVFLVLVDPNRGHVVTGSGFVIERGVVATNHHVIEGGGVAFVKVVQKEALYRVAGMFAIDRDRDIALLAVPDLDAPPLELAASETVAVGDRVYALGNPAGFEGTFSEGLVSAKRSSEYGTLIQMSAPISLGSSGGPILDSRGRVVGMASLQVAEGQNLNFAVASEHLAALVLVASAGEYTAFPTDSIEADRLPQRAEPGNRVEQAAERELSRQPREVTIQPTDFVVGHPARLYESPDFNSPIVARLSARTILTAVAEAGEWFRIRSTRGRPDGYIHRPLVVPYQSRSGAFYSE